MDKNVIRMTSRAIQFCMCAGQNEPEFRMVKTRRQPGAGGMTLAAIQSQLGIMSIVPGMAGITRGTQGGEDVIRVALRTIDKSVLAGQRELRFCVIKCRRQPGGGRMAGIAGRTKHALVGIILGMAGIT